MTNNLVQNMQSPYRVNGNYYIATFTTEDNATRIGEKYVVKKRISSQDELGLESEVFYDIIGDIPNSTLISIHKKNIEGITCVLSTNSNIRPRNWNQYTKLLSSTK